MDSVVDFSIVETKQNIDLVVSPTDTSSIQFDIVEQSTNVNLDIAVKGQKGDTAAIVEDTTPQLGGDLDLNGNDITGAGNISITGEIEADIYIGSLRGEIQFKAKAGEALTKGDPVYISSHDTVGNTPIVAIADANDSEKMPCFGLANESVSLNASVNVVTFGTLSGLDTSGFGLGDTLYISNTGTLTNSKPTGESSLIQNIGKVQRVHNSAGSIKVGGAGRTNDVPNLNNGNVFIGNASNQSETRLLTLDDIAETDTNKHFTASDDAKLDRTPFVIWAEESGDLSATVNSGFQWSFGSSNMTPAGTGVVLPFACDLIAISLSTEGACTVQVEVYKNNSGTGKSISIASSKKGHASFESSPVSYSSGDIVNFKTLVGDGLSNGGVFTAWFTRV